MRGLAAALVLGGGLVLLGAGGADWVTFETAREVGGVPVAEVETTPGTEVAPGLMRDGLLALLGGLGLLAVRGRSKRALGGVLVALGALSFVQIVVGWRAAARAPGDITAAATVAGVGALAVVVGAVVAVARPLPPPRLGGRYTLDEDTGDAEWDVASDEEPPTMPL